MKNKILSNLSYVLCAVLGLLHYVCLAFPCVASFLSFGSNTDTDPFSGYEVMDTFFNLDDFSAVMSALLQVFILILAIAMLLYAVCGLLKAFGVFEAFPEKLGKIETKKIATFAVYGYAALNFLLLIFLIIFCATKDGKDNFIGISSGFRLGAGIFISLVLGLASGAALILQPKYFPAGESAQPQTIHVCSKCGKKAKSGVKFCSECGGAVEERIQGVTKYICSACGKETKKGVNFCPDCGGKIEEKQFGATKYLCSSCGKEVKKDVKFCPDCGGKIEEKTMEISPVAEATEISAE